MSPAARVVDCRGMPCPRPVIELAKVWPEVAPGEEVDLVADDPAAAVDVPAWCRMRGEEYVGASTTDDGVPVHRVRRRG